MSPLDPRICAHRGWTEEHLENTLAAFEAVVAHGGQTVELDVRRTRDAHWVVYHDADLERLHGKPGSVAELRLDELLELAPLPLLAEALEIFAGHTHPLVEVKEPESDGSENLLAVVSPYAARHPLTLVARGTAMPRTLLERAPEIPLLLYTRNWNEAERRREEGFAGYDLCAATVPREEAADRMDRLRSGGKKIAIWTVNDPEEFAWWLELGADWVVTARPWEM